MKSKGDFIIDLLNSKKLSNLEKDRVLNLTAKEYEKNEIELENISKLILNLEHRTQSQHNLLKKEYESLISLWKKHIEKSDKKINQLHEIVSKVVQKVKKSNITLSELEQNEFWKKPNPKHVADFMSLFNQRDGLKYLTHDYDEDSEFQIDKFLVDANLVFKEKTSKLNIPKSLWKIVEQFAFRGKEQPEWTSVSDDYKKSINHKIGWASPDLRKWSKENKLHPIRNLEYEQVINDFKRITRIKEPDLEKLINTSLDKIFENDLQSYEIHRIQLKKADFYTHVVFLKMAIESIFKMIKEEANRKGNKKINIEYIRGETKDGYYSRMILITHYNSFPTKELELLCKEWNNGKGSMGEVKNKLDGYCHWSIETIIDETPTRVNLLKDETTPEFELNQDCKKGFTHVLTFYYK
jgi:hypothetical protein